MATDANPMHCAVMFTITVWPTMDGFGELCNVRELVGGSVALGVVGTGVVVGVTLVVARTVVLRRAVAVVAGGAGLTTCSPDAITPAQVAVGPSDARSDDVPSGRPNNATDPNPDTTCTCCSSKLLTYRGTTVVNPTPAHSAVMFTTTAWPTYEGLGALCKVSVVLCSVGADVVAALSVVVGGCVVVVGGRVVTLGVVVGAGVVVALSVVVGVRIVVVGGWGVVVGGSVVVAFGVVVGGRVVGCGEVVRGCVVALTVDAESGTVLVRGVFVAVGPAAWTTCTWEVKAPTHVLLAEI